jgi:hypothetical protein
MRARERIADVRSLESVRRELAYVSMRALTISIRIALAKGLYRPCGCPWWLQLSSRHMPFVHPTHRT